MIGIYICLTQVVVFYKSTHPYRVLMVVPIATIGVSSVYVPTYMIYDPLSTYYGVQRHLTLFFFGVRQPLTALLLRILRGLQPTFPLGKDV